MRHRVLLLLICLVGPGCPGQRRPDPRWAAAPAPASPSDPPPAAPKSHSADVPVADGLAGQLERVRGLRADLERSPRDAAIWRALMDGIGRAEETCFRLLEGPAEDAAAAEQALDELTVLRDEVVRLDPQAGSR